VKVLDFLSDKCSNMGCKDDDYLIDDTHSYIVYDDDTKLLKVLSSDHFLGKYPLLNLCLISERCKYPIGAKYSEYFEDTNGRNYIYQWVKNELMAGHINCVESYHHEYLFSRSAESGMLNSLKFLRERNIRWDEWTCNSAACSGKLDCLKHAHENGCPWSERTCYYDAREGKLDCLKYAHENGCPWDERTINAASDNFQTECLEYARSHGFPYI